MIEFLYARRGGYECSSKGDKRFSALFATMPDGRTIEQHYQCDVKGYQPGGTDWKLGKGKPPLDRSKDLWEEYLQLWRTWASEHPDLIEELRGHAIKSNNILSDCFASTPVNQARALAVILNDTPPQPTKDTYMKIAIIGTAGRDKTKPMTKELWSWMITDVMKRILKGAHVVSGGAAWADHLAVYLFLSGHAANLTLHLPAPFWNDEYTGPKGSSASAANYYHALFSQVIGEDTRKQITKAASMPGCDGSFEEADGYRGMFLRNDKVAKAEGMLAYTFGEGDEPADGGTKDTWDKCRGEKVHVQLPDFSKAIATTADEDGPPWDLLS